MDTVRERLLQAVLAGLQAINSGYYVYRLRDIDIDDIKLPAIVLRDGTQDIIEQGMAYCWYRMLPSLEIFVGDDKADNLGPLMNALYGQISVALQADPTWGGRAVDTECGDISAVDVSTDDPELPNGAFEMPISIDFWTKSKDPYTVGP